MCVSDAIAYRHRKVTPKTMVRMGKLRPEIVSPKRTTPVVTSIRSVSGICITESKKDTQIDLKEVPGKTASAALLHPVNSGTSFQTLSRGHDFEQHTTYPAVKKEVCRHLA